MSSREVILEKLKSYHRVRPSVFVIIVFLACFLGWSFTAVGGADTTGNGLRVAKSIISGIFHPDWEIVLDFSSSGLLYMLLETVAIAFLGTIIGAIISVPLGFLASSNIVPRWVSYIVKLLIMTIRTIPSLIYGIMFIKITGPGPFAGLLTMSFTSIGMLTKLFSDNIMNLKKNVLESLEAMGCTTFEKIRYGILPQLFAIFLSTIIYRFDINLRDATILGLVGAGGIGSPMMFAMSSYKWNAVGSILLGLIILILFIEYFSGKIRSRLIGGVK